MTNISTEAREFLTSIGAVEATRLGASGPNGRVKRGAWEIKTTDGERWASSAEARKLNALSGPGYGVRTITA